MSHLGLERGDLPLPVDEAGLELGRPRLCPAALLRRRRHLRPRRRQNRLQLESFKYSDLS